MCLYFITFKNYIATFYKKTLHIEYKEMIKVGSMKRNQEGEGGGPSLDHVHYPRDETQRVLNQKQIMIIIIMIYTLLTLMKREIIIISSKIGRLPRRRLVKNLRERRQGIRLLPLLILLLPTSGIIIVVVIIMATTTIILTVVVSWQEEEERRMIIRLSKLVNRK